MALIILVYGAMAAYVTIMKSNKHQIIFNETAITSLSSYEKTLSPVRIYDKNLS